MVGESIIIDDQPMAASFFNEGKFLTEYITPDNLEVQDLHQALTAGIRDKYQRIMALHNWVGSLKYTPLIRGRLEIAGRSAEQKDLWVMPSMTARVKIGNCATKSFLLTSLLRRELPASDVYCVLGNLYNGHAAGHAWVGLMMNGQDCILEATRADAPMVLEASAPRYEPVHYFNDKEVRAIEGRTLMQPFEACFSTWLKDYLNQAYIEGARRH